MHTEQRNPQAIAVRCTDSMCPSPEDHDKCSTAEDIRARIALVERRQAEMQTAFILNDLSTPDFDGHRQDHRQRKEAAKIVENYKITATTKLVGAVVTFLLFLFSTGATTKLMELFKAAPK